MKKRTTKSSGSGRSSRGTREVGAVAALLELFGRRWLLRVFWELRDETLTFRAVQARCNDMSPSVLNRRIADLREAGLVETGERGGYRLTREGSELLRALRPVVRWAERRPPRGRMLRHR